MSILNFTKRKRRTPDEFQHAYELEHRAELKRILPWILGVPVVVLLTFLAWAINKGLYVNIWAALGLLLVIVGTLSVVIYWSNKPRRNEGKITRSLLDETHAWDHSDEP